MKRKYLVPSAAFGLIGLCASLSSCGTKPSIRIINADPIVMLTKGDQQVQVLTEGYEGDIEYRIEGAPYAIVNKYGFLTGEKAGTTTVVASIGEISDSVAVQVIDPNMDFGNWGMSAKKATCRVGDRVELSPYIETEEWRYLLGEMVPVLVSDPSIASFEGTTLVAKSPGEAVFAAKLLNLVSDFQSLTILG